MFYAPNIAENTCDTICIQFRYVVEMSSWAEGVLGHFSQKHQFLGKNMILVFLTCM